MGKIKLHIDADVFIGIDVLQTGGKYHVYTGIPILNRTPTKYPTRNGAETAGSRIEDLIKMGKYRFGIKNTMAFLELDFNEDEKYAFTEI